MSSGPSDLGEVLREGDALIIVPPFASIERPSLAAHVLQACAREAGFRVSVLYANILFAAAIGADVYARTTDAPPNVMLGERLFARSAHGIDTGWNGLPALPAGIDRDALPRLDERAVTFADEIAESVAKLSFSVIGASTT